MKLKLIDPHNIPLDKLPFTIGKTYDVAEIFGMPDHLMVREVGETTWPSVYDPQNRFGWHPELFEKPNTPYEIAWSGYEAIDLFGNMFGGITTKPKDVAKLLAYSRIQSIPNCHGEESDKEIEDAIKQYNAKPGLPAVRDISPIHCWNEDHDLNIPGVALYFDIRSLFEKELLFEDATNALEQFCTLLDIEINKPTCYEYDDIWVGDGSPRILTTADNDIKPTFRWVHDNIATLTSSANIQLPNDCMIGQEFEVAEICEKPTFLMVRRKNETHWPQPDEWGFGLSPSIFERRQQPIQIASCGYHYSDVLLTGYGVTLTIHSAIHDIKTLKERWDDNLLPNDNEPWETFESRTSTTHLPTHVRRCIFDLENDPIGPPEFLIHNNGINKCSPPFPFATCSYQCEYLMKARGRRDAASQNITKLLNALGITDTQPALLGLAYWKKNWNNH